MLMWMMSYFCFLQSLPVAIPVWINSEWSRRSRRCPYPAILKLISEEPLGTSRHHDFVHEIEIGEEEREDLGESQLRGLSAR